ncbi:MAG: DNA-binding protein [Candidatus Omnitrophica bacterium]|nr:DNA-binding protein [Candidatus Omnitrophota bacterium]
MKNSKLKSQKSKVCLVSLGIPRGYPERSEGQGKTQKFRTFKFLLVVFTFYFSLLTSNCFAQSISSSDLINNAKAYDGKIVSYQGEVIGDVMVRGDFAWINLNDAENAIGIWLPKESVKIINYKGSYKQNGDWLEVTGVFHRSCLEHGGDLDIHAASVKKLSEGSKVIEQLNLGKQKATILFLGLALCLGILQILRMRR